MNIDDGLKISKNLWLDKKRIMKLVEFIQAVRNNSSNQIVCNIDNLKFFCLNKDEDC
ncbi:hypothetical protein Mic7113_4722 [Allocoleopsis franciscana PCC 7113]|uniref:Uncharacterized protein n=1 Tax=Allocoleopsis franciscana PCC 7113 TaxID=1173027 RepID=K9WJ12_9CYAN|nr:hypothetical protein Mic7113_4722 [Allocoleopsis franciscana PCC 7113]